MEKSIVPSDFLESKITAICKGKDHESKEGYLIICQECLTPYCGDCQDALPKKKQSEEEDEVPLCCGQTEFFFSSDFENDNIIKLEFTGEYDFDQCPKHLSYCRYYYCLHNQKKEPCKKIICSICTEDDHSGHFFISIQNYVKTVAFNMKNCKKVYHELYDPSIPALIEKLENYRDSIAKDYDRLIKQMEDNKVALKNLINKSRTEKQAELTKSFTGNLLDFVQIYTQRIHEISKKENDMSTFKTLFIDKKAHQPGLCLLDPDKYDKELEDFLAEIEDQLNLPSEAYFNSIVTKKILPESSLEQVFEVVNEDSSKKIQLSFDLDAHKLKPFDPFLFKKSLEIK